ncbi:MAG: hypothetical protein HC897_04720, partial [Thermoanaerobaculia bacterium]|nr:hypothetical protein [Thermoanaerobaculia bacterium]
MEWEVRLRKGEVVHGIVSALTGEDVKPRYGSTIQHVTLIPIFKGTAWWGYLGIENDANKRVLSHIDIESLKVAADSIGAALQRQQYEAELRIAKEQAEA